MGAHALGAAAFAAKAAGLAAPDPRVTDGFSVPAHVLARPHALASVGLRQMTRELRWMVGS